MAKLRVGVDIASINKSQLANLPVPLPPVAAQRRFADGIRKAGSLAAHHDHALTQLDALFASLQARAFAGEL
jgi:type I restriction enzyme S subunit